MIEFTERVGADPKVFPGVSVAITEDKPEPENKPEPKAKDEEKNHKKDDDGDAAFDKTPEHEKDGTDEEDVHD